MKTSNCKGCGAPILWAVTADGKKIPLDPRASIYRVGYSPGDEAPSAELQKKVEIPEDGRFAWGGFFVSHFQTCPNASDFSGRSRRPQSFQQRIVRK